MHSEAFDMSTSLGVTPAFCLIGILSNVHLLITLSKNNVFGHIYYNFLSAIAALDLASNAFTIPIIASKAPVWDFQHSHISGLFTIFIFVGIQKIFIVSSCWTLFFLMFDLCLHTFHRNKKSLTSRLRVSSPWLLIFLISMISIVETLPTFWYYQLDGSNRLRARDGHKVVFYVYNWVDITLTGIIYLILLFATNIFILWHHKYKNGITDSNLLDKTAMLCCVAGKTKIQERRNPEIDCHNCRHNATVSTPNNNATLLCCGEKDNKTPEHLNSDNDAQQHQHKNPEHDCSFQQKRFTENMLQPSTSTRTNEPQRSNTARTPATNCISSPKPDSTPLQLSPSPMQNLVYNPLTMFQSHKDNTHKSSNLTVNQKGKNCPETNFIIVEDNQPSTSNDNRDACFNTTDNSDTRFSSSSNLADTCSIATNASVANYNPSKLHMIYSTDLFNTALKTVTLLTILKLLTLGPAMVLQAIVIEHGADPDTFKLYQSTTTLLLVACNSSNIIVHLVVNNELRQACKMTLQRYWKCRKKVRIHPQDSQASNWPNDHQHHRPDSYHTDSLTSFTSNSAAVFPLACQHAHHSSNHNNHHHHASGPITPTPTDHDIATSTDRLPSLTGLPSPRDTIQFFRDHVAATNGMTTYEKQYQKHHHHHHLSSHQ